MYPFFELFLHIFGSLATTALVKCNPKP